MPAPGIPKFSDTGDGPTRRADTASAASKVAAAKTWSNQTFPQTEKPKKTDT